jgi:hypothetical protein
MKRTQIALSCALITALSLPSVAESDIEVTGFLKAETGVYTSKGESNNPAAEHGVGDFYKKEATAKFFVNGGLGENATFHSEFQLIRDTEGVDGYDGHRINSQYDYLRELYVDTSAYGWDFRLGKQQVVWGKADGVKFLDIINPTDFRHWGQDAMEDSRIPLWMVKAAHQVNDTDSIEVVYVPQVNVTNQIPGLYSPTTGDIGQPFVPKGMDTMLGDYNGFMNIGNDMGTIAGMFKQFAASPANAFGGAPLSDMNMMTVSGFTSMEANDVQLNTMHNLLGVPADSLTGAQTLGAVVVGSGATTNLYDPSYGGTAGTNYTNPIHMFDYMGDTTFATFDSFAGITTKYRKDHVNNDGNNGNFGVKYAGATDGGLNYTFNYYYHYDNNPVIDVSWEGTDGNGAAIALKSKVTDGAFDQYGQPATTNIAYRTKTVSLVHADGTTPYTGNPATMVFTETQNRINTFGTSFDYALDTSFAPIVIRGEFVYDKGTKQPVVDLGKLAYGDIDNAFTVQDADFINYVIGADVTVFTNLFVSVQFMDKWNLDYVNGTSDWKGTMGTQTYGLYTANPATMSLGNQFDKAEEHQIMYTLYLSKPLLESDAMRVNNLFLYENDNGGYWDRFDLEYSYSDDITLSAAYNFYGGDRNGVFGQFQDMSNVQVGIKYIF